MRLTAFTLGILGGLAGIGVHAALLIRFFSQSHGLLQVFLDLLLALLLGLAALLITGLCRRSPWITAVFSFSLGILGFFPRPLSWIPAGVLLMASGAAASAMVRSQSRDSRESRDSAAARASTAAPAPVEAGQRPLHWSEAARLGGPAAPIERRPPTADRRRHNPTRRAGVIAGAMVAAAIVIPLSFGAISLTESPGPDSTDGSQPPTPQALAATATTASTTTTTASFTTTTAPADDEEYAWYSDDRYGFTLKFPASWRNTDPGEVGQRLYRQIVETYAETFVPVAFADWNSPTFNGCYLDYVWVEVYDETFMEVPTLPELRNHIHERLDYLEARYAGVRSIEPLRDVVTAGMLGSEHVWSIPYGGRVLVLKECVFATEGRAYFIQFAAVEDDWEKCQPVFEEMLRDFTVRGPEPVS